MEVNNDTNQIDTSTTSNENATPAHTFSSSNLNISSQLTSTAMPTPNTPPPSTPSASKSMKHFKKSMIVEYERIESNGGADEHSQSSTSSTSSSKSASGASNHSNTPTSFANTAISSLNAAKSSLSANDNEELSNENNKRKRKLNEQSDHNLASNSDLYEDESAAGARASNDETKSFKLKREMDFSEFSDNNARSEFESETGKEVKRKKNDVEKSEATPKTSSSNPKSNKSNQNSNLEQRVGEADRSKPVKKEKDKEKAKIYCICKSADTQRFMM